MKKFFSSPANCLNVGIVVLLSCLGISTLLGFRSNPVPVPVYFGQTDKSIAVPFHLEKAFQDLQPKPLIKDLPKKLDFSEYGRGYKPLSPEKRAQFQAESNIRHSGRLAMLARFQTLPASFDCRAQGWVIPVGDQGSCGSCYLYSTIYGTMTQAFVKAGYGKPDGSLVMAVQFGMDCQNFGGCGGGNGSEVINWAVKNGTWPAFKWVDAAGVSHNDYPAYQASSGRCRTVSGAKGWKPADWGYVSSNQNQPASTQDIKTALYNFGPLNVSLDAGGQFGNGSGTITSLGRSIDHEIELVAWDDDQDGGAFLLKNQWSTSWGNNGYRWVTYQAAQNLVDVFFVTATPLPPPPNLPVITSSLTLNLQVNVPATYQIVATNNPTSYGASGLPAGFTLDQAKGIISGTPTQVGTASVVISASNAAGVGNATLQVAVSDTPIPPSPGTNVITITGPGVVGGTATWETVPVGTNDLVNKLTALLTNGRLMPPTGKEPPLSNAFMQRLSDLEAGQVQTRKDQAEIRKLMDAQTKAMTSIANSSIVLQQSVLKLQKDTDELKKIVEGTKSQSKTK